MVTTTVVACGATTMTRASKTAATLNAAAHTVVITTLTRWKSGSSQTSRGAIVRAMPSVNGLRTASEPHAVAASQALTSAGPYGVKGDRGAARDSTLMSPKNTTALTSMTI